MAQGAPNAPEGSRPWEDRTLSDEERYKSYYDVVRAKCEAIRDAGNRPGVTAAERYQISQDPEANFWVAELRQLKAEGFQRLINTHFDQSPAGRNEVLLNTNHRLVARALEMKTVNPLASVLRLLVANALVTAGASLPREAQRRQVEDLDWIAEALWGRDK